MVKKKIEETTNKIYGKLRKGNYKQKTIRQRIEALFLDNIGKIITSEQICKVAMDPVTKKQPENWHQRLSELRTDEGYTISFLEKQRVVTCGGVFNVFLC
jgi:hypothetical protein